MKYRIVILLASLLLFNCDLAFAQGNAPKVFLLEDAPNNQWCSYNNESTWKEEVRKIEAMTVGTMIYSNDRLVEIDVTETDQTGDWTVYDRYLLDDHTQLVKLARLMNVLRGDASVSQTFSIRKGNAAKIATSAKQLSTGKPLTSSTADWLPALPIEIRSKMFPFYALLSRPDLRISSKSCVSIHPAR